MKIFLSYAVEQRRIAREIELALTTRDHEVFFDESDLRSGEEYHARIEQSIENSDLFVFLISPDSLTKEYPRTELGFARRKWRNPSGRVLPVMAVPTLLSRIDPYLRAVTILYPQGHLPAEVASRANEILHRGEPADAPPSGELLRERIDSYRELWELTGLLPRWPRSEDIGYDDLAGLSTRLRDWYFTKGGGMFLSREAHQSYSALQSSLTAILLEHPGGRITDEHYDAVRELCSALRSRLAQDVGARR